MAFKNRQNMDSQTDDNLNDYIFENLSTGILVELLKQKIATEQANTADIIQKLVDDKHATVVIIKRN